MQKYIADYSTRRRMAGGAMLLLAAANTWLGYSFGGYYLRSWAIFALVTLVVFLIATGFGLLGGMRSRYGVAAIALLLAYTSWTFLSILWSDNRGDAWFGSSLTLVYLVVFWTAATLVAAGVSRRLSLAALSLGPGVVALVTVSLLDSGATDGSNFFMDGRLMGPAGYFNAQGAILLTSFWSGIYASGSRRMNPMVRGLCLASTMLCLQVAVLTQSRGTALAFAVSLIVFFLLSGQRLRGLLAFAPVAVCTVFAFPALNEIYLRLRLSETITGAGLNAISGAERVILISAVIAAVYGLGWGLLERSWRPPRIFLKTARIVCLVAVAALIVVGSLAVVQRVGNPVAFAQERWTAFKTNDATGQDESRYLSASGSGRFILWQVAWQDFTDNPVKGVGTHNYESTYYQSRPDTTGWVKQPHSLPLEVLAERGIVGGLLFFGFLGVCVGTGLYKRFSQLNHEGKGQTGAILACLAYWFTHSSAEWFWQITAVTIPAMIYLALLVVPWRRPAEDEEIYWPLAKPIRLAGVGIAVLTLAAITPLYISSYYQQKATADDNPWVALRDLDRAQTFDPLNSTLAREEGDMAYRIGDIPRASEAYARAIDLNPGYYANYAVLGGLYENLGEPRRALELYEQAIELNPLEEELRQSAQRARQSVSQQQAQTG